MIKIKLVCKTLPVLRPTGLIAAAEIINFISITYLNVQQSLYLLGRVIQRHKMISCTNVFMYSSAEIRSTKHTLSKIFCKAFADRPTISWYVIGVY